MRFWQRDQAKCKLCGNWFAVIPDVQDCLTVCEPCIEIALSSRRFKVQAADGCIYQLQLVRIRRDSETMNGTKECDLSVCENSSTVSMLCQIDDYQQAEIEACREKWNNLHNKLEDWVTCGQDTNILREIIRTEINCRSKAYGIDCATQMSPERKQYCDEDYVDRLMSSLVDPLKYDLGETLKCNAEEIEQCDQVTPLRAKKDQTPMRVKISSEKKERKSFMAKKKEKENIPLETRSSKIAKMKKSSCFHIDENLTQQFAQTGLPRSSISPFNPSRIESTSLCSSAVSSRFTVVESLRMSITSYLEQRSKVPIVLHKIMTEKVLQYLENTANLNNSLELVALQLAQIDLLCYLNHLEWEGVQVLKLIKVGLEDQQFRVVVGFIESHTAVETLVVTNNALTDEALVCLTGCHRLKHIYLGNNQIQSMRVKQSVKELKERFTIFL